MKGSYNINIGKWQWLTMVMLVGIVILTIYLILHNRYQGYQVSTIDAKKYEQLKNYYLQNHRESENDSVQQLQDSVLRGNIIKILNQDNDYRLYIVPKLVDVPTDDLIEVIGQLTYKKNSWFWFEGNKRYLEVVFWALFGVICGLLFNVTQALKTQDFNPKLLPDHVAKLFYGPFVVVILFLSIDLLADTNLVNITPDGYGLIVFAFILGFFSRRTMLLLDKIKKFLLPLGEEKKEDQKKEEGSTEVTLEIAEEAIEEKGEEWLKKYGAESLAAGLKVVDGIRTSTPCIYFIVENKDNIPTGYEAIPSTILYKEYKIPTDVKQEEQPISHSTKFQPGSKIVRQGTSSMGTLGLKVSRGEGNNRIEYILSCYHVMCVPELKTGRLSYSPTSENNIYYRNVEGEDIAIAEVEEGEISGFVDVAIARIKEGISIDAELKEISGCPKNGIRIIKNTHVANQYSLFTYGAESSIPKSGIVESKSISRTIIIMGKEYYFNELIPVSNMSQEGDSGAPVVDGTGKIVGIIIGGSSSTTYVVPISNILKTLEIDINYA